MVGRVLRFIRLPLLLIFIFAVARFSLGAMGVPYAPRGNAMFSIVVLTFVSNFYFGALSRKVGFGWGGTLLAGYFTALFAQSLVFIATYISYAGGIETSYFRHWDALNAPPGTVVPMAQALATRTGAFIFGPFFATIPAVIGRLLSALAPEPVAKA